MNLKLIKGMRLVAATHNPGKAREIEARFSMLEKLADHDDALMERMHVLQTRLDAIDGWNLAHKVDTTLDRLGLARDIDLALHLPLRYEDETRLSRLSRLRDGDLDQGRIEKVLILVGEQTEFATNALTLIVPEGNPAGVTGLNGTLKHADLVICAPEVPCGAATVKLEKDLGVTLDPVSEEQKVTDVRGKVESGEADAGIVYATDAKDAGDAVETVALPANDVINHYPIAVTKDAKNAAAAQAFVDYVLSRSGQTVLQGTYGFGAPGAGADASRSRSGADSHQQGSGEDAQSQLYPPVHRRVSGLSCRSTRAGARPGHDGSHCGVR